MINSRALLVTILLVIFFSLLIAKLFDVQVVKNEEYKYYAQRQQTLTEKIPAQRGMIYDRNNVLLAYNRNDVSFYVDLRMAGKSDKEKIASRFSEVFGKSKKSYLKLMSGKTKNICIEKKVSGNRALLLKDFKAVGFFSREDPTRVYHYGSLASHLIGYVGNEYEGVAGIEKNSDLTLKGESGARVIERSAIGDLITVAEAETRPAVAGLNIHLTINKSYQAFLEEELKAGLKEFKAVSATGILMDPNTGEILALANADDFDPNTYWQYNDNSRRNRALTDTYEPGSTFKSISMAALLDQKLCNENELLFVENGKFKFRKRTIRDTHEHDYLTVKGIFEQSSNVGMAKLVQRINDELYYKYLRGFGFGNVTSLDLPGEVKGKLKKPSEWSGLTKTYTSFGYEISVTPIQLITAYSALINGGTLYEPQIIKKATDLNQNIIFENEPKAVRTVITSETSARMREFLKGAVKNGTGENALSEFFTVGGKTGTSQLLIDGKYSRAEYNTSFVGFFPADQPKVVCLILVNSPSNGRYGGLVAAPIFKRVAEKIYLTEPALFKPGQIKNTSKEYEYKFAGNVDQSSKEKNSTTPPVITKGIMPDLKDYAMRDAIVVLTKLGIKYRVTGSGKVTSQSIEPGTNIDSRAVCKISCSQLTEKTIITN
jgi:cell division protein FtsI (penicillin-binding protein 3)